MFISFTLFKLFNFFRHSNEWKVLSTLQKRPPLSNYFNRISARDTIQALNGSQDIQLLPIRADFLNIKPILKYNGLKNREQISTLSPLFNLTTSAIFHKSSTI